MGFFKFKQPVMEPSRRFSALSGASSSGAYVGPRGAWLLGADSSAGGAAPRVVYLAVGKLGDVLDVFTNFGGCTSNGIALRTPTSGSSGQYFANTTTYDNLLFMSPGYGARLICASSYNWVVQGVTTAGPSTIWPGGVMGASTS